MAMIIGTFACLADEGFDRLRHDAVVRGNHQNTISVTLAPRARIAVKAGMTGRIEERDFRTRGQRHLIGADVLSDAAASAGTNLGLAQGIQERRFCHDRHGP